MQPVLPKILAAALVSTLSQFAMAQCVSPAGVAGQFAYSSGDYRFCDGNGWFSMKDATAASGACSPVGVLNYSSGPRYCNASSLYQTMVSTETGASCSGTPTGSMQYFPALGYMQSCNGTNWKPMRGQTPTLAYVQQATIQSTTTATSYTSSTFSAAVTTGNGIICGLVNVAGVTISSVVMTGSQSFTKAVGPLTLTGGANGYQSSIWYLSNATGGSSYKIVVTMAASNSLLDLQCWEYSGLATSKMLDQTTTATSTGTTLSTTVTTTSAEELLVLYSNNDNSTNGTTTGWNKRAAEVDGVLLADKVVNTKGSQTIAVTGATSSSANAMVVATFRLQ